MLQLVRYRVPQKVFLVLANFLPNLPVIVKIGKSQIFGEVV